ncbi:MAG TPA: hypothetical protein EYM65_08585, partial [Dehalococcoidia bacterium]|nr:hypothetical protein [Dehalococcoidia bacterium]
MENWPTPMPSPDSMLWSTESSPPIKRLSKTLGCWAQSPSQPDSVLRGAYETPIAGIGYTYAKQIGIESRSFRRGPMATETQNLAIDNTKALVKITEMDHIVLRVKDVEVSLKFYCETLGMHSERVDQWRAGEIRFPSARLNADTLIDFFGTDPETIGKEGI